jgi:hypothetical protein
MSSAIFHINKDNVLAELRQTPYDSEALLQRLLADHPSILGVAGSSGGRLLLIAQEFGVPEASGTPDRWSLDHLFVDQDGVPVLVEVKRGSDTRARREVVAQMLDYAANGAAHWTIDKFVSEFKRTTAAHEQEAELILADFVQGTNPDAFWRQVEANLRGGRIRLVFVADRIPSELRAIVEFLNEQMRPAEVLAIEVEQFTAADGVRTLVPRLVGNTQRAQATKSVQGTVGPTSEADVLEALGEEKRGVAERVIGWFRSTGFEVGVPEGRTSIAVRTTAQDGLSLEILSLEASGRAWLAIANLGMASAFESEAARQQILDRFRSIAGLHLSPANKYPSFPILDLQDEARWENFRTVFEDMAKRLRAASPVTVSNAPQSP